LPVSTADTRAGNEPSCPRCGSPREREPVHAGVGAAAGPDAGERDLSSWFGAIGGAAPAAVTAPAPGSPTPRIGGPRLAAPPLRPGTAIGVRAAATMPAPGAPAAHPASGVDAGYFAPARLGVPDATPAGAGSVHERVPTPASQWASPATPAPKRSASRAIALLVLVAIGLGVYAGRPYLQRVLDPPPEGTQAFLDGGGVAYAAPDGSFAVRLPATPVVESVSQPVGGFGTLTAHIAYVSGDGWEMAVASADVGAIDPALVDTALSGGAMGFASGAGPGRISEQSTTKHDGHEALDAVVDLGDDHAARVRVVYDGRRVYVLTVHSRAATGRLFDELTSSFEVVGAAV
jgi:hypothetical protein